LIAFDFYYRSVVWVTILIEKKKEEGKKDLTRVISINLVC